MGTRRVSRVFFVSFLSLGVSFLSPGLVACGSGSHDSSAGPATPPTTLTGNWFLAGQRVPAVYPVVSTSLFVQGSSVFGEASFTVQCTSGGLTSTVAFEGLPLSGNIAADGSFQVSSGAVGSAGSGTSSLSLTGSSPLPASPLKWTGSYSLVYTPGTSPGSCAIAQTAPYAAVAIAPVTGTYTGVPIGPSANVLGADASVTLQLVQDAPIAVVHGSTTLVQVPLTASLTISNAACGDGSVSTMGALTPSTLTGDRFNVVFVVPNSPGGGLNGTLDSPTGESFSGDLTSLARAAGCPAGVVMYEFRRSAS